MNSDAQMTLAQNKQDETQITQNEVINTVENNCNSEKMDTSNSVKHDVSVELNQSGDALNDQKTPLKRELNESTNQTKSAKKRRTTERLLKESEALLKSYGVDSIDSSNTRRTRSQTKGESPAKPTYLTPLRRTRKSSDKKSTPESKSQESAVSNELSVKITENKEQNIVRKIEENSENQSSQKEVQEEIPIFEKIDTKDETIVIETKEQELKTNTEIQTPKLAKEITTTNSEETPKKVILEELVAVPTTDSLHEKLEETKVDQNDKPNLPSTVQPVAESVIESKELKEDSVLASLNEQNKTVEKDAKDQQQETSEVVSAQ